MTYIVFLLMDQNCINKYINTDYIELLTNQFLVHPIHEVFFISYHSVIDKVSSKYGQNMFGYPVVYLTLDYQQPNLYLNAIKMIYSHAKNTKNQVYPIVIVDDHNMVNRKIKNQFMVGLKLLNDGSNVIFGYNNGIIGLQPTALKLLKNALSDSDSIKTLNDGLDYLVKNGQIKLNLIELRDINPIVNSNKLWFNYAVILLTVAVCIMCICLNLTFY